MTDLTNGQLRPNGKSRVDKERVQELARGLNGVLLQPEDGAYDEARQLWNGMIDRRPAFIARCADAGDVLLSVNFARQNELRIAVRGGGHNVAGLASVDGGMVIDLGLMNSVKVDPRQRTVYAEGGVTIGELDRATQQHALAVPMGVVSRTGIAGLTLGGGYGWLRNKYGLSCDSLLGAELVTAGGQVLQVSEKENADLLWGLRGGGGNFGVVTRLDYRAYPVGPDVFFTFVFHEGERMVEALKFYRQFCADAPDEVSSLAFSGLFPPGAEAFPVELHGRPYIAFAGMYSGTAAEGRRQLDPLRSFKVPLVDFSDSMPYVQAQQMLDEDYPDGARYYWKSLNLLELTDEAIERFVTNARRQPSPYSTTDLWHVGGAVKRFGEQYGAFYGRQAAFLLNPEANWHAPADDAANIRWVREFVADMRLFSDGSRYLNFAGLQEEGDQMMRDAFGRHYQRLAQLKARYDPHNLFRLNQNVQPAQG